MDLSGFFHESETLLETHSWTLVRHDSDVISIEAIAEMLADGIIKLLCRGRPQHYRAWRQCKDNGMLLSGSSREAIAAFIRQGLGLPEEPIIQDHLGGFVAEYLWYFLSHEINRVEIIRIEYPRFAPTDHGDDGLIIHRMPDGYLVFRLWEIKKYTGDSLVANTVNTAYRQLNAKATEYLIRYTSIGQELENIELADFYSRLIEIWINAGPSVAAGVSVVTFLRCVTCQCFTHFGNRFQRFTGPVRLQGLLMVIGDFSYFARKVKKSRRVCGTL